MNIPPMTTIEDREVYRDINNEANFLKKEISFLMKILTNCYSTSLNVEKIKILDTYWKNFEANIVQLNVLQTEIATGKKTFVKDLNTPEETIIKDFNNICNNVKSLKDTFYEFMQGCNACSLKSK